MSAVPASSRRLRLGIIGLSPGNGHPYSWSGILNGYDPEAMAACPFPAIPEYLLASPPEARLDEGAEVTHVWTQDESVSRRIAAASRIGEVVLRMEDMLGEVDAVLLARDDAENHLSMARPFLEAGLPIFIDKPLALDSQTARAIYALERHPGQIFTCTGLRFAREFNPPEAEIRALGDLRLVEGISVKDWEKYSVHCIEPALMLAGFPGMPSGWERIAKGTARGLRIEWPSGLEGRFLCSGVPEGEIALRLVGTRGEWRAAFGDTLHAFSASLRAFLAAVRDPARSIPMEHAMITVRLIELGRTDV